MLINVGLPHKPEFAGYGGLTRGCPLLPSIDSRSAVGFSHRPFSTVLGGFTRGIPRLPSIEAVSAEPSPQTNAPAPNLISISKEKSVPKIFFPSNPYSLA